MSLPEFFPYGISPGGKQSKERAPTEQRRVVAGDSLARQFNGCQFFFPALYYHLVGEIPDPFAAFLDETDLNAIQGVITFPFPVVDGFPPDGKELASQLYFMPDRDWEAYRLYLGTIAVRHREYGLLRLRLQQLHMADPAVLNFDWRFSASLLVYALIAETPTGCFYFKHGAQRHRLVFDPRLRYTDTIVMSDAVSSESSNPYKDIDRACESESAERECGEDQDG